MSVKVGERPTPLATCSSPCCPHEVRPLASQNDFKSGDSSVAKDNLELVKAFYSKFDTFGTDGNSNGRSNNTPHCSSERKDNGCSLEHTTKRGLRCRRS